MPTRGPKSGGPEDPSQKPKPFVDLSSIDNLVHKISESEQRRMAKDAGETGWVNPNNFQEAPSLIPPLVPPRPILKGTPPSARNPRPGGSPIPASPPPQPPQPNPVTPPANPPTDLHLYSGKPEQLADMAEKAAIASRAAAFKRANRYSGKVLDQAKGLYDQLKGTGFESVGKQAVIAASNAFQASQDARRESRESRRVHAVAKLTKNPDDILRAQRQTLIADKARDLHEQASNFSARFFRDIAQKGVESVNKSINANGIRGNSNWYQNWLNQIKNNMPGGGGPPNNPPGGGPPNSPPPGGNRSRSNQWGRARRRLRKTRQRRIARANLMAQRMATQSQKKSMAVGMARRKLRKARRVRAKRHANATARAANAAARAKKIQQIKTLAKIGLGSTVAHQAASGNFMGAARTVAWSSGNPIAIIGTELASAAATAAKALSAFTEHTFEANKYLSNYSGTLAYAYGTFVTHEYGRKFQYSAGVSESGKNLVESMDKMRDQWMRYNIASGNIANTVSSLWARASGGFAGPLGKEAGVFAEAVRTFSGMKVAGITVGDTASAAGSAASEALISSAWTALFGPAGSAARLAFSKMFPASDAPPPVDGPMVAFLKDMRDRKESIRDVKTRPLGPTFRELERPVWKRGARP